MKIQNEKLTPEEIEGRRREYRRTRIFLTILCDGAAEALKQNAWYEDELPFVIEHINGALVEALKRAVVAEKEYAPCRQRYRRRFHTSTGPKKTS